MLNPFEESFFDDEELPEENPELTLKLCRLARVAIDWISTRVVEPIRRSTEEVRKVLDIRTVDGDPASYAAILAVDSTWTSPPLELVSGSIAIIVAGYIVATPSTPGFYGVSYVSLGRVGYDEERFSTSIELRSKILEFETAKRVLERFGDLVELAMIDGPMPPAVMYRSFYSPANSLDPLKDSRKVSGTHLASYVATSLLRLVDIVDELGIPLVGVVKRVSSRFLEPFLRSRGLDSVAEAVRRSNDKTLMSYVLRPGEYVVLGTVKQLLETYLASKRKSLFDKLRLACEAGGELEQKLCRFMERTVVVYYMPRTDALYPQAVRLDIYPVDRVEEVVSYAMDDSSHTSVPTPIDLVDRFVRMEALSIRRFHELMQSYATDLDTLIAIGFTNPQKYYLYRRKSRYESTR